MKPIITLFHKEFRQHGAFALAMVILCLLFQVATYESSRWFHQTVAPEMFLFIALVITALYAGAAAALAYSTEHADNTYTFLRKLPISTTTLALGKIGWVLCGTVLVLLCNSLLAAVWSGGILDGNIAAAFGVSVLEMFIWGLFWSTRCRSQVHAMLAGFVCASLTAWLIANMFAPFNNDPVSFYLAVVPHRLVFIAVIACFALWGALRWFEFDAAVYKSRNGAQRNDGFFSRYSGFSVITLRFIPAFVNLRYPQKIQHPFLALVHQHIRHTSILYPLGIAAFVVFSLGCLYVAFLPGNQAKGDFMNTVGVFSAIVLVGMMVLFWGNIFGHDQKNDSYRFLSRLGIHEGKVWWSRMLPALLFYLPVIICFVLGAVADELSDGGWKRINWDHVAWNYIFTALSLTFTIWLAPAALGAFFSISFRSQMVAIALTIGGTLTLIGWMAIFLMLFGSSPLWTTVPIAIALLIASRLRAKYWLRETYSWRSRLMPLVPFFAVMLAIPVALPLVRVYSIPYVSWEQIDSYFDQADLPTKRNPEKRKALLQYIAAHGTVPEEYEAVLADFHPFDMPIPEGLTYEEYLLIEYASYRHALDAIFAKQIPDDADIEEAKKDGTYYIRYMPWEKARLERALRMKLVLALVDSEHGYAFAYTDFYDRIAQSYAFFEPILWFFHARYDTLNGWRWTEQPLDAAYRAIDKWYKEHGTLPESLDELDGTYVHPFTDEPVRYYVNSPPPQDVGRYSMSVHTLDGGTVNRERWDAFRQHGGTYLVLGSRIYVLIEPEEEMVE